VHLLEEFEKKKTLVHSAHSTTHQGLGFLFANFELYPLATLGNHPQRGKLRTDLVKFGYSLDKKFFKINNPPIFWRDLLDPYCLNLAISEPFFLEVFLATLVLFFAQNFFGFDILFYFYFILFLFCGLISLLWTSFRVI
jgi:hypothetical protein